MLASKRCSLKEDRLCFPSAAAFLRRFLFLKGLGFRVSVKSAHKSGALLETSSAPLSTEREREERVITDVKRDVL